MDRLVNQAVGADETTGQRLGCGCHKAQKQRWLRCYQGHSGHCRRRARGTLVQPTVGQLRANPRC